MKRENDFELSTQKAWATYALVFVNTMAFLATQNSSFSSGAFNQTLVELGALHPLLLWKGEIWRLGTAVFLHGGVLHYAFNTFVLLQIGRLFEPLIGSPRLLFLFLVTGMAGFALSVMTYAQFSVGSSGAVFGLIGGMLGALLNLPSSRVDPKLVRTLIFFVVLNLLFGLVANNFIANMGRIDNASHIGGLLFGVLFGYAFVTETTFFQTCAPEFKARRQKIATAVLLAALVGFFAVMSAAIKPVFLVKYHEIMAFDALISKNEKDCEAHAEWLEGSPRGKFAAQIVLSRLAAYRGNEKQAYDLAHKALQDWPEDVKSFWKSAMFERKSALDLQAALFGDERGNAVLCKVVIDSGANEIEILNDCAWLLLMSRDARVRDPEMGLKWALLAVRIGEIPTTVFHTLAEAYLQNGSFEEAIHTIDRGLIQSDKVIRKELIEQQKRAQARLDS